MSSEPAEIYLDWNATTPPHPDVLQAMAHAQTVAWANPASVHAAGRRARAIVEDTRELLASVLTVHPRDVLFTSGGTEANNLALTHALGLVVSRLEHPSVTRIAELIEKRGVPVEWLPVRADGQADVEALPALLERLPRGSTVALMAANHETGVLQPLARAAEITRSFGAWLHVDAVQALGKIDPEALLVADTLAVAAHKIRGPKGIGALAWRQPWVPKPVLVGGAQERGLRPGTVDASLAAGFRAALERCDSGPARALGLAPLRDELERALAVHAVVNGAQAPRLPHVANLSFHGWKGDELVAALDLLGVRVSSGSACSAGTTELSPVITAMVGAERARGAVRFSLGEDTTRADLEAAIAACQRLVQAGEPRT